MPTANHAWNRNALIISICVTLTCVTLSGFSTPLIDFGSWGSATVQTRWQCTIAEDGNTSIRIIDGSGGTQLSARLSNRSLKKLTNVLTAAPLETFKHRYEAPVAEQETYFLRTKRSGSTVIVLYGPHLICDDPDVRALVAVFNTAVSILPKGMPPAIRAIECDESE